ncbi:LOW QUALITY PROTEIN: galectin-5-like [Haliaeetus albicilla]|uniref:LOW QUALITY PROTEIN: galectin-5-like n=1 Tax=Haliaeetus albicilla TaxID=8969 RepID=UPI0037E70FF3
MAFVPVPSYQPAYNPVGIIPGGPVTPPPQDGDLGVRVPGVLSPSPPGTWLQTIPYHHSNLPVSAQPPSCPLQPVPFVATIGGGLIPKKIIVVKGFILPPMPKGIGGEGPPPPSLGFHINLRAGPGGGMLLHLNLHLGEGVVVCNSLLGSVGGCGVWGAEEQDLPHNPFQRSCYFDLSICCGNHCFKVFAKGQPLCNFSHHLPLGPHVDTLEVDGDVVLSYVHF